MAADLILGLDIGTTSVKTAVIGLDGRSLLEWGATYPISRPAGGVVEQDASDWTIRIDRAVAQVVAAGLVPRIAAIGLTSQVNTHLFLDARGQALMPAIVWQDSRAAAEAAEIDAGVTADQKLAWWGAPMPIDASHVLARMAWVARHRPEVWTRTASVVLPKDFCLAHLTGEYRTDPLSNIGMTNADGAYLAGVLDLVPGAAQRMVPLARVTQIMGQVRNGHPLTGVPVVTGTMDGWCALYGAGGCRDGAGVYVSGTSEVLGIVADAVHPTPGVIVFPDLGGVRLHAGPTQSGGAALAWFATLAGRTPDAVEALVAAAPRATLTPLFLPHLQGERAPLWDPGLRGVFLGMDQATGLPDLARGVYEGVAMSARHVLQVLERSAGTHPAILTCGGGGFRSALWTQIRADVLDRSMRRLAVNEPALLGAAALAAHGAGHFASLSDAHRAMVRYGPEIAPDPARRGLYDDLFGLYLRAIDANAALNAELVALSGREP
ncbi:MAG: FGGY-family carbohydrate kinase [Pseudomonadota bacterium]